MENLNSVTISGNIVKDCDKGGTENTPIVNFSIAVNERRKNSSTGEWEDYPNFFECSLFGPRAKTLAPYLVKGAKLAITGHLRHSRWEKDGKKNSKVSVIVDRLEFMSKRTENAQESIPFDGEPW